MTNQTESHCITLCIARHMARIYGLNEARAITRAAKVIRDQTRDQKLYELVKAYTRDLAPQTINGVRMTGDAQKVFSVANLEQGMRDEGVL